MKIILNSFRLYSFRRLNINFSIRQIRRLWQIEQYIFLGKKKIRQKINSEKFIVHILRKIMKIMM